MIEANTSGAWKYIEGKLRPYVARRLGSAADIDDVLQEIFIRVHSGLSGLHDGERFGGWVYRIAEHALADFGRRRARAPIAHRDAVPDQPAPTADDSEQLQSDLGECVALFVARLPSPYREAITLTELEGLTQSEAADMLDISLSGMKSRVQRGREKIREMFEECCQISVDCRGRVVGCEPRNLSEVPEDCRGAAVAWSTRERRES